MPPSRPFHLMAKPTGAACNLGRDYCDFRKKEGLFLGSSFRMSDAVLEAIVEQMLAAQPGPEVAFAWQGAEPTLMGLDFFERAVAPAEARRRPHHLCERCFAFFTRTAPTLAHPRPSANLARRA